MSAVTFTRWKGGTSDELIAAAKSAKTFMMSFGAKNVELFQFRSGASLGEWLFVSHYANWEAAGKAADLMAADAEYTKLFTHVMNIAHLAGRDQLKSFDI